MDFATILIKSAKRELIQPSWKITDSIKHLDYNTIQAVDDH